jgi:3-hydroxybutyrate dehydrogenase
MAGGGIAGRTVVITGAGSGIGQALALGFLADGAKVFGADISPGGLKAVSDAGGVALSVDVTSETAVRIMVRAAVVATCRIDVLFNNAGVGGRDTLEGIADGVFEQFVAVHLFGGFYGVRSALPIMRAQGYGRIINTLSRGAEARQAGWAAYGSAKAGLLALTRVAAAETAGTDVLVNGMIPGPTRTGMMHGEGLQAPAAVYPWALKLATLPTGGPSGRVFWNGQDYRLFAEREG